MKGFNEEEEITDIVFHTSGPTASSPHYCHTCEYACNARISRCPMCGEFFFDMLEYESEHERCATVTIDNLFREPYRYNFVVVCVRGKYRGTTYSEQMRLLLYAMRTQKRVVYDFGRSDSDGWCIATRKRGRKLSSSQYYFSLLPTDLFAWFVEELVGHYLFVWCWEKSRLVFI
jgi:hypothetical protein